MGRLDEALASYDRAIEAFPQSAVAQCGRAATLRAMGRLDEALATYDRAIEAFPQDVYARCGRAETLRAMGRLDEALASYDRIIEAFPQDACARSGRAETLRAMGRLEEAYLELDQASLRFEYSKFISVGKAVALCDLGRLNEARVLLTELSQNRQDRSEWVAAHVLCMIDLKQSNYKSVIGRLEELSETCPYRDSRKYFQTTLASMQMALGEARVAKQAVSAMLESSEFDAEERSALMLMDAHAEAIQGNTSAAKHSIDISSVVFPYEQFALLRLRAELERRFGLAGTPALNEASAVKAANSNIARMETDFWVRASQQAALAA